MDTQLPSISKGTAQFCGRVWITSFSKASFVLQSHRNSMWLPSYDLFGVWSWVNYLSLGSCFLVFFFFFLVCTTSKIIFSSASASPLGGTSRNNPARSRLQILSQHFPPEVILPLGRWQGDLAEPLLLLRAKRTRTVGGSSSGNGTFFTLARP